MGAEKIVKINSEHEADMLRERVNTLETVITYSVAEQIKRDKEEIERLKQERDTLKGQISNFEKWRADLISETKRQIEEKEKTSKMLVNQATTRRNNVETDYNQLFNRSEEEKRKLNAEINKLNNNIVELEKKIIEYDALLKSREEEIERLTSIENKIDTIYEILNINFEDIKTMLKNNDSKEVIIKAIDEIEETVKNKAGKSKEELEAEDREIIRMLNNGKTESEVADIIYSHLDDPKVRRVQLSKRKKTKRYIKIANEELVGN